MYRTSGHWPCQHVGDRMKKGGLVYNRKHFITKKLSYTEGALSAVSTTILYLNHKIVFFVFFFTISWKKKSISHEMTVTVDYIQQWERRVTAVAVWLQQASIV